MKPRPASARLLWLAPPMVAWKASPRLSVRVPIASATVVASAVRPAMSRSARARCGELALGAVQGAFEPLEPGHLGVEPNLLQDPRIASASALTSSYDSAVSPMSSISRTSSRPHMTCRMNSALRVTVCQEYASKEASVK